MGGNQSINPGVKSGEALFNGRTSRHESVNSLTQSQVLRRGREKGRQGLGRRRRRRKRCRGATRRGLASSTAVPNINSSLGTAGALPFRRFRRGWRRRGRRSSSARGLTPEGAGPGVVISSTPGTLRQGRTVPGYMADTPAPVTPRLIISKPLYLTWWQTRKEIKGDSGGGWVRKAPNNHNAVNGRTILNEASGRVHTWELLSKTRVHINGEAGEDEAGKLSGPFRRVKKKEWQRQKLTRHNSVKDVRASSGNVHKPRCNCSHLDLRQITLQLEGRVDSRQPSELRIRGRIPFKGQLDIRVSWGKCR